MQGKSVVLGAATWIGDATRPTRQWRLFETSKLTGQNGQFAALGDWFPAIPPTGWKVRSAEPSRLRVHDSMKIPVFRIVEALIAPFGELNFHVQPNGHT